MDVIKAIESYPYYHSMTGQSREEWQVWRVQAVEEWMLDKAILEKGEEASAATIYGSERSVRNLGSVRK